MSKKNTENFEIKGKFLKSAFSAELGLGVIYLIASKADIKDDQGDTIPLLELIKAAHQFMKESRKADMDHDWGDHGDVVESMIFDKTIIDAVKSGKIEENMWIVGIQPSDKEVAAMAHRGEIAGASIGGFGRRSKE